MSIPFLYLPFPSGEREVYYVLFFSGDKEKVPEEVMLKSELSYIQEEMERLKHKHQQNLTEQARQQQEIHRLTVESTRLRQQLAQEEAKHRDAFAYLQNKCSELEQENNQLGQSHQSMLHKLKVILVVIVAYFTFF